MTHSNTILVVDDETKIAEVLQSYLEKEGFRVVCAHSGNEALSLFDRYSPVLVLLDLMLPDLPGEEVCRAIRKKSRVPVIMLTAKTGEADILKGLGIGADDYVTKPFSPRQVVARVNAVLRRVLNETVTDELAFNDRELVIDNMRHEVLRSGEPVALTPIEFKLLLAMVKYPTKTFTREELIAMVLGDDYEGYDRVIDTHIKNLRQKIEPDAKKPRYILTVHGIGYKFGGGA
jgi:DNA-binding response OmpR family regulator